MPKIQLTAQDFANTISQPLNQALKANNDGNQTQTGQAAAQKITEIAHILDYLNECTNRLENCVQTLEQGIEWYEAQPNNIKDGELLDTLKTPATPTNTEPHDLIVELDIAADGEVNNVYAQDGKCYPADSLHYKPIEPNAAQHYKGVHEQTTQTFIDNYIIPAATYIQSIQPPQKSNETHISSSNQNSITNKLTPTLLDTTSEFFTTQHGKTLLENQGPQPRPGEETKYSSQTTLTTDQRNKLLKLADQAVANATPYAWGGGNIHGTAQGTTEWDASGDALYNRDDLKDGFDCSSLVQYLHYQATGKDIGRTTYDQLNNGFASVEETDKQVGDLGYRGSEHVVMYVGDGKIVEAPESGGDVSYRTLTDEDDFNWKRP